MYGSLDTSSALNIRQTGGSFRRTAFGKLLAALKGIDFGRPGEPRVHWCYVTPESAAHMIDGIPVGHPCCPDPSLDPNAPLHKLVTPRLNYLQSAWDHQPEGRWTWLVAVLRKVILLVADGDILAESLKHLAATWKLDKAGIVATLTALLEKDQGAFQARGQLRLVRIVEVLSADFAGAKLAIMLRTLECVEQSLYGVLGRRDSNGERIPVMLYDLLGNKSPVAEAQRQFVDLLSSWEPGSAPWHVLEVVAGPEIFDDLGVAEFARAFILETYGSLYDHFEWRLALPPYCLALVAYDDI